VVDVAGDLATLAGAVSGAADLVYLMNEAELVRALTLAPGLLRISILASPVVPPRRVIALDADDFASGGGDDFDFEVSTEAAWYTADPAKPIVAATAAVPVRSLRQTDSVGLRFILHATWGTRRPGRVASWMRLSGRSGRKERWKEPG
jgi:hypothetical protein